LSGQSGLQSDAARNSFVATSGVIAIKSTTQNLATSTTFSGVTANVSGDTDGNGSLDLTFESSWAALITR